MDWSVQEREKMAIDELETITRVHSRGGISLENPQARMAIAQMSQAILARTWFMHCVHEHNSCEDGRTDQFYPMRLINVRGTSPRLVLSANTTTSLSRSYATLSHRWTDSDHRFALTMADIPQFQTGIPRERISPTLSDVILVCKALEVPYIWVDVMCIVQHGLGSQLDWEDNGSVMASIYTNSIVNIAAEIAKGSRAGFIHRDTYVKAKIPTRFSISGYEFVVYPTSASSNIPRPLENRGWIVQEMLLAPRILRFALGQMSWECTQNPCACEAFPGGMSNNLDSLVHRETFNSPQSRDQHRLSLLRKEILRLEKAQNDPEAKNVDTSTKELQRLWLDVVEAYSSCDLTFSDADKLIAMSGIANRVSGVMKSDYIAGSFLQMLPRALLWKVEKPGALLKDGAPKKSVPAHNPSYRAPTWSWASLDKSIDFTDYCFHAGYPLLTEVLDSKVVRSHEKNPFGPISQADLIVRGNIKRFQSSSDQPATVLEAEKYEPEYVIDEDVTPRSSELLFLAIQHTTSFQESVKAYGLLLEEIEQNPVHSRTFLQQEGSD